MLLDIWSKCKGQTHIHPLNEKAWRIVETQHVTATRKLVDSLEEQTILEELIDSSKPQLSPLLAEYHPLLATPFRYPPLKYGSRFGNKNEHALWYGSLALPIAMAEKAFYQFNFLRASAANFGVIEVALTAFAVQITTQKGIQLTQTPFTKYAALISSPSVYAPSQKLGNAMRRAGVQAFTYQSARAKQSGTNIALFTPKAFSTKKPLQDSFQSWQCIATKSLIEFIRASAIEVESFSFPLQNFLVNGELAQPTN